MVAFRLEGTVLTDSDDRVTLSADLEVELHSETCDWLTEPAVAWFRETVTRAVIVEFNRYIEAVGSGAEPSSAWPGCKPKATPAQASWAWGL